MTHIKLDPQQEEALKNIKNGSILCGGTGSGKSITSIAYYHSIECLGSINPFKKMKKPKDLYIITTAKKRDSLDWVRECSRFHITVNDRKNSLNNVLAIVDSWNNIHKYKDIKNAFFIFDEQRLVGNGAWVKSFYKIAKENRWILLSATPGDNWNDYVPVFIANGFYKNRTEFELRHAVFNPFVKFKKIDRYVDLNILNKHKQSIIVEMQSSKKTIQHHSTISVEYDKCLYDNTVKNRWNPYEECPIKNPSQYCFTLRKIINSDISRIKYIKEVLLKRHNKVIIFYNYNYELELIRKYLNNIEGFDYKEYNGHIHQDIPISEKWIYAVQYFSGAEAWECTSTNVIIFYSENYSYKIMIQSAGRIDRRITPYIDLYYYHFDSGASMDKAIIHSLKMKKKFNENNFVKF